MHRETAPDLYCDEVLPADDADLSVGTSRRNYSSLVGSSEQFRAAYSSTTTPPQRGFTIARPIARTFNVPSATSVGQIRQQTATEQHSASAFSQVPRFQPSVISRTIRASDIQQLESPLNAANIGNWSLPSASANLSLNSMPLNAAFRRPIARTNAQQPTQVNMSRSPPTATTHPHLYVNSSRLTQPSPQSNLRTLQPHALQQLQQLQAASRNEVRPVQTTTIRRTNTTPPMNNIITPRVFPSHQYQQNISRIGISNGASAQRLDPAALTSGFAANLQQQIYNYPLSGLNLSKKGGFYPYSTPTVSLNAHAIASNIHKYDLPVPQNTSLAGTDFVLPATNFNTPPAHAQPTVASSPVISSVISQRISTPSPRPAILRKNVTPKRKLVYDNNGSAVASTSNAEPSTPGRTLTPTMRPSPAESTSPSPRKRMRKQQLERSVNEPVLSVGNLDQRSIIGMSEHALSQTYRANARPVLDIPGIPPNFDLSKLNPEEHRTLVAQIKRMYEIPATYNPARSAPPVSNAKPEDSSYHPPMQQPRVENAKIPVLAAKKNKPSPSPIIRIKKGVLENEKVVALVRNEQAATNAIKDEPVEVDDGKQENGKELKKQGSKTSLVQKTNPKKGKAKPKVPEKEQTGPLTLKQLEHKGIDFLSKKQSLAIQRYKLDREIEELQSTEEKQNESVDAAIEILRGDGLMNTVQYVSKETGLRVPRISILKGYTPNKERIIIPTRKELDDLAFKKSSLKHLLGFRRRLYKQLAANSIRTARKVLHQVLEKEEIMRDKYSYQFGQPPPSKLDNKLFVKQLSAIFMNRVRKRNDEMAIASKMMENDPSMDIASAMNAAKGIPKELPKFLKRQDDPNVEKLYTSTCEKKPSPTKKAMADEEVESVVDSMTEAVSEASEPGPSTSAETHVPHEARPNVLRGTLPLRVQNPSKYDIISRAMAEGLMYPQKSFDDKWDDTVKNLVTIALRRKNTTKVSAVKGSSRRKQKKPKKNKKMVPKAAEKKEVVPVEIEEKKEEEAAKKDEEAKKPEENEVSEEQAKKERKAAKKEAARKEKKRFIKFRTVVRKARIRYHLRVLELSFYDCLEEESQCLNMFDKLFKFFDPEGYEEFELFHMMDCTEKDTPQMAHQKRRQRLRQTLLQPPEWFDARRIEHGEDASYLHIMAPPEQQNFLLKGLSKYWKGDQVEGNTHGIYTSKKGVKICTKTPNYVPLRLERRPIYYEDLTEYSDNTMKDDLIMEREEAFARFEKLPDYEGVEGLDKNVSYETIPKKKNRRKKKKPVKLPLAAEEEEKKKETEEPAKSPSLPAEMRKRLSQKWYQMREHFASLIKTQESTLLIMQTYRDEMYEYCKLKKPDFPSKKSLPLFLTCPLYEPQKDEEVFKKPIRPSKVTIARLKKKAAAKKKAVAAAKKEKQAAATPKPGPKKKTSPDRPVEEKEKPAKEEKKEKEKPEPKPKKTKNIDLISNAACMDSTFDRMMRRAMKESLQQKM